VLVVTTGISVGLALAFGLLPALGARRVELQPALAGGQSRGATSGTGERRLRGALVVGQVALSIVLVVGAGLLLRTVWHLRHVDPGFRAENVLRLRFQLPATRYPQSYANFPGGWTRVIGFHRDLVDRVEQLPGVRRAALAASDPLTAGFTNSFLIEGREAEAERGQAELATRPVSAGYFEAVGVPLLEGRMLGPQDDASAPAVILVNEAMARRYFPGQSAIGRRLQFWGQKRTIVGVVGNERFQGLAQDAAPAMYPPMTQAPMTTVTLLVRTTADPRQALAQVRTALWGLDREVAPYDVATLDEALSQSIARERFTATLLSLFAGVALLLAVVGVYGVTAYGVAQRRRELGVRLALGATGAGVVRLLLGDGLRTALAGCALGLGGAWLAGRALASQLAGVAPSDPLTLVVPTLGVLLAVVVASWLPARRAGRLPPSSVLRAD
jgi:putative ABC transport system permease protein